MLKGAYGISTVTRVVHTAIVLSRLDFMLLMFNANMHRAHITLAIYHSMYSVHATSQTSQAMQSHSSFPISCEARLFAFVLSMYRSKCSPSTTSSFSIEADTPVRTRSSEHLAPTCLRQPLDSPQCLLGLTMRSHAHARVDVPDLRFAIESTTQQIGSCITPIYTEYPC